MGVAGWLHSVGFYRAHQEVRLKEPSNPTPEVREKVPEERDSPRCRTRTFCYKTTKCSVSDQTSVVV